jgi:hypothetical protein
MVNSSRVRIAAILGLVVLVCLGARTAAGQSLGDVARREAERRKAVKGPVSVYTNDNVRPAAASDPGAAPASAALAAPTAGAPGASGAPGTAAPAEAPPAVTGAAEAAKEPKQDREYWRKRMDDLQSQRDRNTFMMDAVQSRINGLWADFTARDDPAQRAVIESDRNRALAELERMKKDQSALDKKIADLYEEARRANVPPGWLR